ncbi:hypothetical protein F183_A30810 [Bryobacterales bacterium F-183]|nr:hypothetical protein F183_A30810 [Bryobacterales bacterium F-183]
MKHPKLARWIALTILALHIPLLSGCILADWIRLFIAGLGDGCILSSDPVCPQQELVNCVRFGGSWNPETQVCHPPRRESPRRPIAYPGKTPPADELPDLPGVQWGPLPTPFDPLRIELQQGPQQRTSNIQTLRRADPLLEGTKAQ